MKGRLRRLVRALTSWAWDPEFREYQEMREELEGAKRYSTVKGLQLSLLEELFREKQGKISRLQQAYTERRSPVYEDMRKEQPLGNAEAIAQSITMLAARAEAFRARTGKTMRHSDGTIVGVPGDKPNVPVGETWR